MQGQKRYGKVSQLKAVAENCITASASGAAAEGAEKVGVSPASPQSLAHIHPYRDLTRKRLS